ncbi:MAG: DNA/RNA non-specific endonuclease [Magnetococcales bacterium]|nr:DNA/RNA non-specific endonuclease [Magnetococcales bacterium]
MSGYDHNFLGKPVPLPGFSAGLKNLVLNKTELREGVFADYVNYTVAMHSKLRTPLFAALNIDQSLLKSVKRSNRWLEDDRIGRENQLNNDYYRRNDWDRGHLARRSSAAWGVTNHEARQASDDTFFYSNASLQHANFNQDEWLELEDWVLGLTDDSTNKINSVSGPIFADHPRSITPEGRETALIPAGFFKVISYIDKDGKLATKAFVMWQDADALRDKKGKKYIDLQRYQVTVTEIENLTGLIFPDGISDSNPLRYNPDPDKEDENESKDDNLPERLEVDEADELIISPDSPRTEVLDDNSPIYIVAAQVNPKGSEIQGEWISIINLSGENVNLDGWYLRDPQDTLTISGDLGPGEARRFQPISPIRLGNKGGSISLFNANSQRIDRVRYRRSGRADEGKPFIFNVRSQ